MHVNTIAVNALKHSRFCALGAVPHSAVSAERRLRDPAFYDFMKRGLWNSETFAVLRAKLRHNTCISSIGSR